MHTASVWGRTSISRDKLTFHGIWLSSAAVLGCRSVAQRRKVSRPSGKAQGRGNTYVCHALDQKFFECTHLLTSFTSEFVDFGWFPLKLASPVVVTLCNPRIEGRKASRGLRPTEWIVCNRRLGLAIWKAVISMFSLQKNITYKSQHLASRFLLFLELLRRQFGSGLGETFSLLCVSSLCHAHPRQHGGLLGPTKPQ